VGVFGQALNLIERSSMLHVRMDNELKYKATETLAAMGLSASTAVRLLFHRIVADQAFPLELKVPNAETQAAMAESEEVLKSGESRFATADEMFAELEKTGRGQANRNAAWVRVHQIFRKGLGKAVAVRALRHEASGECYAPLEPE